MKTILAVLGCLILFVGTSCTKQYVTATTPNKTVLFTVLGTSGWSPSTDQSGGQSYSAALTQLPELDSYVQQNDGVLVYFSYDGGATYEALPETYNGISYSYTSTIGAISLFAQGSDGSQLSAPPSSDIQVKVVLVESAQ